MVTRASSYQRFSTSILAAGATLSLLARATPAYADDVSPKGKGIVGGGLLGAEVITLVEAAAGVKPGWAYLVGAIVGAGGGAASAAVTNNPLSVSVLMAAGSARPTAQTAGTR